MEHNTSQINKDSPAIQRILKATGCSSVEELLARDQQKIRTNKATNGSKATNGAGAKSTATNGAKSTANTNGSNVALNRAKNVAKSVAKGSKSMTNPKKKATSKYNT